MNESVELEIWKKIHGIIAKKPGIDLHKIIEQFDIKADLVELQIQTLEKYGEITIEQNDSEKRCYVGERSLLARRDRRAGDTRIKMYCLIVQNPGLHLSRIAELLGMSSPLAEYHLSYLEKNNYVMSVVDEKGYYKRFYVKYSEVGREEKKSLALLRQETVLKIVLLLLKNQCLKHKEIAEKLRIAPSTLSHHLNKLVDNNVIEVLYYGEEKGYALKDVKEIVWIVRKHKLDQLVEGFKDTWSDLDLFEKK